VTTSKLGQETDHDFDFEATEVDEGVECTGAKGQMMTMLSEWARAIFL
jgi:hypothetical protein